MLWLLLIAGVVLGGILRYLVLKRRYDLLLLLHLEMCWRRITHRWRRWKMYRTHVRLIRHTSRVMVKRAQREMREIDKHVR
jgi:hypothetical protein